MRRSKPVTRIAPRPVVSPDAASQESAEENRVHAAIVGAVMSHRLPPGTRLVETPLTQAFGVSRSLLRRVLVRLASDKVIDLQHNRGATVAQPTQAEMREVFEVRRLLESGILRALGNGMARRDLVAVRELVREERAAYEAGQWSNWIRLSGEYHLQVARLLDNAELEQILRSLIARTTLMIALYDAPGHNGCSFDEHDAILDALQAGDSEQACMLMTEHLAGAERKLRREGVSTDVDLVELFSGRR